MKMEIDLDSEPIEAARRERGEVRRLLLMEIGQAVLDSIAFVPGDTVTDGQTQARSWRSTRAGHGWRGTATTAPLPISSVNCGGSMSKEGNRG